MKSLNFFLFLLTINSLTAQTVADFENINLPIGGYDNDAGDSAFFGSGNALLPNEYVDDPNFPYWNGWAISTMTDVTTPGFGNQYSCIAGEGANGSKTYALGYVFGDLAINLTGNAVGGIVNGFYVNNSTYAYFSMLEGDGFAKKFGGENGNDPDFFKLTVRKWLNGVVGTDSVEFYLADYRFSNNSQDYIVTDWTWVDLSSLGPADLLMITMSSSDVGAFGINTPTYFCMDDLQTADSPTSSTNEFQLKLKLWPNPVVGQLQIEWPGSKAVKASILDVNGVKVRELTLAPGQNEVPVSDLVPGCFNLQVKHLGNIYTTSFIKH